MQLRTRHTAGWGEGVAGDRVVRPAQYADGKEQADVLLRRRRRQEGQALCRLQKGQDAGALRGEPAAREYLVREEARGDE